MRQYNLGRSRVAFGYQSDLHKVPEKYLEGEKDLFFFITDKDRRGTHCSRPR